MDKTGEKTRKIGKLSIVIPVYFNEENLYPLYDSLKNEVFDRVDHECEVIMVNDGSKDSSWQIIQELAGRDDRIRGITLSRKRMQFVLLQGIIHILFHFTRQFTLVIINKNHA